MAKKISAWKTKGMNQDLSVSAFNPEFAYENRNLRLSTNEGNTLMSWVNERGTKLITLREGKWNEDDTEITATVTSIVGNPLGTAIINHQIVLFTHASDYDYIYIFKFNSTKSALLGKQLYKGNLNFNLSYPLETRVFYEADHIQKVYWTDYYNQPRMINVAGDSSKWIDTSFDFIPAISYGTGNSSLEVAVNQSTTVGGLFAPGVIQYCFTYFNKYAQQSNIVYISSLFYLAHKDRGGSPEEKVTPSFVVNIKNADTSFDYIRLYSIQRTSINGTPIVKILDDIAIESDITFVDNGTIGSTIDPYELLYVGGKEIKALTMTEKDYTLFIGNITEVNTQVTEIQDYFDDIRDGDNAVSINFLNEKKLTLDHAYGFYGNTNMLTKGSLRDITTFKGGEWYRFGFQLQKVTGEWLEPIFIDDKQNTYYPQTSLNSDDIKVSYASADIDLSNIEDIDLSLYQRIRPVIVYPTIGDREVLCQGVLNPTVFNTLDRLTSSPYSQASWYFRPYNNSGETVGTSVDTSSKITSSWVSLKDVTDPTITVDNYFIENGLTSEMYVLVCTIADSTDLSTILSNKCIQYIESDPYGGGGNVFSRGGSRKTVDVPFQGVICLTQNNITKYAFLSSTPWQMPYGDASNSSEKSLVYIGGITDVSTVDKSFKFYSNMRTAVNGTYFYTKSSKDNSAPDSYTFMFYDENNLYTIVFTSVTNAEYFEFTSNSKGNILRYGHYESIYSRSDLTGDDDTKLEAAKQIEIQGSVNLRKTPFDKTANLFYNGYNGETTTTENSKTSNRNATSNTQFFIDQSIVTLNSPDIDFDTEVQTYGIDNLHLRVIGAIPISASIASYHIQSSGSLLDTNHNRIVPTHSVSIEENGVFGNVSTARYAYHTFGKGELSTKILHKIGDTASAQRLVSDYLWNDVLVASYSDTEYIDTEATDKVTTSQRPYDFLIHPWQRTGSLNNDWRQQSEASSWLGTKKEANLLYSLNTEYFSSKKVEFENIDVQIPLTENSEVRNYRLTRQGGETSSEINYYPNVDKVLYNEEGYEVAIRTNEQTDVEMTAVSSPISMKYKSTSHAVISLKDPNNGSTTSDYSIIPILPYYEKGAVTRGKYTLPSDSDSETTPTYKETFWGDKVTFSQSKISDLACNDYSFLWLGEIYKDGDASTRFGGKGKNAIKNNNWQIAGEDVLLSNGKATLYWTDGDTYYQRYDCLKTYPFTTDDTNQLVEILSFMCETHINLDGRYDKNRGQSDNTSMTPQNFNLLNPVYSQSDNFFISKRADSDSIDKKTYPNYIYYSRPKTSGADVDLWTNVTLASTLELDGDRGQITCLKRYKDDVIAFQDSAIAQVLFNSNVQIASTAGVPIELANSGKVDGKRYLSDTIGCSNKWSIASSPTGIYFVDSNNKGIYVFNGQVTDVSTKFGFNSWAKQYINSNEIWSPNDFEGIVSYYDKLNQEVLFINNDTALAFSEKLGVFTSFYDYGGTPYFNNFEDVGIWVRANGNYTNLWQHQAGDYCDFFTTDNNDGHKPYSMVLIGNPDAQMDKVFTNLEFRASIETDGELNSETNKFTPVLPFNSLEVWNEHQHGYTALSNKNGHSAMLHHTSGMDSALKRKFRIWRCDIPRNNCLLDVDRTGNELYSTDSELQVSRYIRKSIDRMRNPWLYLKLQKQAEENMPKTEIHDIVMTYFS